MKRNFKYLPIAATNVTQPLIFTTLTAAILASPVPQTIAVADSSIFADKDWAILGQIANADEERVMIFKVVDPTHVTISRPDLGLNNGNALPHVINSFLRLSTSNSNFRIETKDGNANPIFVGTQGVLTDGTKAETKLQAVIAGQQPTAYSYAPSTSDGGPNPGNVGEVWVAGTAGDQYLPSLGVL